MGKKARLRKERQELGISGKALKRMKREGKMAAYRKDGEDTLVFYNPVKRLTQGKVYKSKDGMTVLQDTMNQYAAYIKQMKEEKEEKNEL